MGFTGGVVTQADVRGLLLGRSIAEALDVELDWAVPAGAHGSFRIYGRGTWQPRLRRQIAQGEPWFEDGDDIDGPLRLRAHGGFEWINGSTTIGLNAQYFGSYRAGYSNSVSQSSTNDETLRFQGRRRIPSQTYVDLSVRRRFDPNFELSLGMINVLDKSPPIVAERNNLYGYSFYGDPRRRRFELTVTSNIR
jgi:outer membrane receptor protein involved in Fe transport